MKAMDMAGHHLCQINEDKKSFALSLQAGVGIPLNIMVVTFS